MPVKKNYDLQLQKLGAVISEVRHDRNLTQMQLAARAGVSRATLGSLESGSHDVMIKNLLDVLEALEVPLEYVLLRAAQERKALDFKSEACQSIIRGMVAEILKAAK